jgi:hypothetical protein
MTYITLRGWCVWQLAKTYPLAQAALAFNFSKGGGEGGVSSGHFGKIAIVP